MTAPVAHPAGASGARLARRPAGRVARVRGPRRPARAVADRRRRTWPSSRQRRSDSPSSSARTRTSDIQTKGGYNPTPERIAALASIVGKGTQFTYTGRQPESQPAARRPEPVAAPGDRPGRPRHAGAGRRPALRLHDPRDRGQGHRAPPRRSRSIREGIVGAAVVIRERAGARFGLAAVRQSRVDRGRDRPGHRDARGGPVHAPGAAPAQAARSRGARGRAGAISIPASRSPAPRRSTPSRARSTRWCARSNIARP